MPTAADSFFMPSTSVPAVKLSPAVNGLTSLMLMSKHEHYPGVDGWVTKTWANMTAAQQHTTRLVLEGLYYAVVPEGQPESFAAYVADLAQQPPSRLRDRLFDAYARIPRLDGQSAEPVRATLLGSFDAFISYLSARFPEAFIDLSIEREAHLLLNDPAAMQTVVVSYLHGMWRDVLEDEWQRVKPMLQASVAAFAATDFSAMSKLEAAQFVTGQVPDGKWRQWFELADSLTFVPSAHVGPYLHKVNHQANGRSHLHLIFGARVPDGVSIDSPELDRSELLVRLNAVADDTRLRVLKLLAEEGELCAPDIMARLALSQSATSRHMRQLSANGLISERRQEGAKCYRLNQERIESTILAFRRFLLEDF